MKHIRQFESYSNKRKLDKAIKESVMVVDDIYRVNLTADVPQSLVNAYIKKVKDTLDKNARQFYSDVQIAEEITKHILQNGLNIDKLDPAPLFGGTPQAQAQMQPQIQAQAQQMPQAQMQPQVQVQPGAQVQGQPQAQPVQGQPVQGQPQGQEPQAQAQIQPAQSQPQAQPQAQGGDFEEVGEEETPEEREARERREEGTEELPI